MSYTYDTLGRRTGRTTPTGAVSSWTYDAAGRRTSLTTSGRTISFEHDAAGHEIARRIGDIISFTNQYDPLGRLTSQHVTAADRSIQRRDYTYRADGNLITLTDQLTGTRTFDLDPAGRVTAVHATNWTERYAYDEAGNQTEASWPATHPGQEAVGTREYTGTTITRAGTIRYEHDALGRITLRQKTRLSRKPDTWRYEWDAEDRMRSVTTPDGTVWRYEYDALGRRTAKQRLAADGTSALEQTIFTWDGTTLCEETTERETLPHLVTLTWDHHGLRPLTQTERLLGHGESREEINERFFAIVTDLIGTPNELVDESGGLAWRTRSTLWGTTAWSSHSGTYTPLRFPGQYFDAETSLHYNYFRHYNSESGRYLTSDPLGVSPAPNPSTYVHNPVLLTDTLGLAPDCPPGVQNNYRGESQSHPGGHHGPAVSISNVKMELGRAGMSVSNYDIVHVPEIRTPDGIAFGNSPHTMDGFPMKGPRGLPLIEVSDIGLRSLDEAVATINHEIFHHKHFELTRNSNNPWGGSEQAAEDYGQQMLDQFMRRRGQ